MRITRLGLLGLVLGAALFMAGAPSARAVDDVAAPGAPPAAAKPEPSVAPAASDGSAPTPPADPWADVPVVKLRDAVAKGAVAAWGTEPRSYQAVTLHLRNKTDAPMAVDIAGSYLEPKRRRSCQRLGLGPPQSLAMTKRRGEGSAIVELRPDEETSLVVNTCCLDAGLPSPTRNEFEASSETLPPVREQVLRWWADNPTAPQSAVNVAIWNFADEVHLTPGVVANYARPHGHFAAVHRGMYYRLTDGVLTTVDLEGVVRILGAEVFQVLPTDDGIYAVALGDARKPKLFLVPMTAESRWTKVMDLDGTSRVREVFAAGKGNLVLVTDRGVEWFDAQRGTVQRPLETEQIAHLSVRRASADRLTATIRRPARAPIRRGGEEEFGASPVFELWSLSLATGKAERAESFWNVGAMLAGSGGVFALSHTQGQLRRLVGDKFTDLGSETTYTRILAAAGDLVWLADADGKLLAVDAKTGAKRIRTQIAAETVHAFDVDPDTGDFAYIEGGRFHWIHAADGRDETVR